MEKKNNAIWLVLRLHTNSNYSYFTHQGTHVIDHRLTVDNPTVVSHLIKRHNECRYLSNQIQDNHQQL